MSLEDKRWDEYDETIKGEVAFYNRVMSEKYDKFVPLDWRYVKAMVWSEVMAGPNEKKGQWQNYPMQIGIVKGGVTDPGLPTLKKRSNGTSLIISQEFSDQLKRTAKMDGTTNIKAGIAWLYYNAIRLNIKPDVTVFDEPSRQIYTYTMLPKETLAEIAKKKEVGTTVDVLMSENGLNEVSVKGLQPGTPLKYKKAHKEDQIGRWENWKDAVLLDNGGGDDEYQGKFERALQIILSRSSK